MRIKNKFTDWLLNNFYKLFWPLFLAILLLCVFFCTGCKGTEKIVYQDRIVVQERHDTIRDIRHDTTIVNKEVHDSVDRYVRDSMWIDSIGIIHKERVVILSRQLLDKNTAYMAKEAECERLRHQVDSLSTAEQKTLIREKKVYVWWPCILVIASALGVALAYMIRKRSKSLKKKFGDLLDNEESI